MVKQLFFLFLVLPFWLQSQSNKELRILLDLPENECAETSPNTASAMAHLSFKDENNIKPLLDTWISKCGYNEAVFRVYVLMSVQDGSLNEKDLGPDLFYYLENFEDRARDAKASNFEKTFRSDKEYFVFIPLNSRFDRWTASWADSLLSRPNVSPLQHFFLSLYANKHSNFISKNLEDDRYDDIEFVKQLRDSLEKSHREDEYFGIYAGTWSPVGNVSNFLSPAPVIGVGLGSLVTEKWSLELSLFARIPINKKDFRISTYDSAVATKNTVSLAVNVFASYDLWRYKSFRLKPIFGGGVEFLNTDVERPEQEEDTDLGQFSITTYNISGGLDFNFRTKNYSYWGIKTLYTVMDYNNGVRALDDLSGNAVRLLFYYYF